MRMTRLAIVLALLATPVLADEWGTHTVRLRNGAQSDIAVPAKLQIVTESWKRVVAVPYIVYMPEKKRLLMLVSCDYPHHPETLYSDDEGATWSSPRAVVSAKDDTPVPGLATGLTYLGDGHVLFLTATTRWLSTDFGTTWNSLSEIDKTVDDHPWYSWDPLWADRDSTAGDEVTRLIEAGYTVITPTDGTKRFSQGYIRFSSDQGATWTESTRVPQWKGVNEVALLRIGNGALMGAYRTDIPRQKEREWIDHYSGMGVTFSKDNGKTWTKNEPLYDYGRHHPSTVLLPGGRLVMTYVVRKGYVDTPEGFPQFGIEAIVSDDNGQSWDLDHCYILHTWHGDRTDENKWWTSSQATSTLRLPGGDLLTAFGTGYRSKETDTPNKPGPRDAGLIRWRLSDAPLDDTTTIRDAPFESNTRNIVDPAQR